jgi:hypothetical protein
MNTPQSSADLFAPGPAVRTTGHKAKKTKGTSSLLNALLVSFALVGASNLQGANVPSGLTGLWRFQNSADKLKATIGTDLVNSHPDNANALLGPWTDIGVESWHTKYSDGGIIQDRSFDHLTVFHGIGPEGKGTGAYINKYTIAVDFFPAAGWNSLYQTSFNGNANDGDLWVDATITNAAVIGVSGVGYSTATFDATKWHRIVWSVDNGNFFRVYVDGTLVLDGPGQSIDGRWALELDRFHLFADDNWEDAWCLAGTAAVWNRPLTDVEIAGMGGWIGEAASPTPLLFPSQAPALTSVTPANGETNVSPNFSYQATILDPDDVINTNSIQLLLDGIPVPIEITSAATKVIKASSGGLLRSGSTHTYTLIAGTGSFSSTNEVTFQVQNYTPYEWRFTEGDLSPALGNGVMDYADSANANLTSFGTTDGTTVPHIAGTPAKFMHVPAFNLDTDGYHLSFASSGPNTGTNASLNRYTVIFDILEPGSLNWTALFNTDPFNLNDADFYIGPDGSVGIGGGGYSATGIITPDSWNRIAFVADLAANTLTYYVNGTSVKTRAANGIGGRWALYSNQDLGPDLLLFNEGDSSGTYTHELYVSSVAFVDRALSASEIAGLGAATATGIFVPSFSPKPELSLQSSGNDAVVSWATNYVGYALEQTDSLIAPQWKPVPGITNNAATISASDSSRFYRLAQ